MPQNNSNEVPIQNKICLTFPQAAQYSGVGENKLRELMQREEFSECILRKGSHKLIKRVLLEEFLLKQEEI